MTPKHMEMDGIVRQIFNGISYLPHLESTLFILCGDHGMNDGGNHGGSAPGETETALLFVSPKLRSLTPSGQKCPVTPRNGFEFYSKVEQSDLAPTISSLMGLPIPRNNLGVLIPAFLGLWKERKATASPLVILLYMLTLNAANDQLQLLLRNALQILKIVKAQFPGVNFSDQEEDVSDVQDCNVAHGQELLACQWKYASTMIREYQKSGNNVNKVLAALHKVCLPV
jgi:ethanolamine phosphate transferase 2 subunit G